MGLIKTRGWERSCSWGDILQVHVEATIESENEVSVSFDFSSSSRIPDSSLSWLGHTICVRGGERIKKHYDTLPFQGDVGGCQWHWEQLCGVRGRPAGWVFMSSIRQLFNCGPGQNWTEEGGGLPSLSWRGSWWETYCHNKMHRDSRYGLQVILHPCCNIVYVWGQLSKPSTWSDFYVVELSLRRFYDLTSLLFFKPACCRCGSSSSWGKLKGEHQSELNDPQTTKSCFADVKKKP